MISLVAQVTDPIFNQLLQPIIDRAGENGWLIYVVVTVVMYFISSHNSSSKAKAAESQAVNRAQGIIETEFKKISKERDGLKSDVKLLQEKLDDIEHKLEVEAEEKRKISLERDKLADELSRAQNKIRVLENRLHDMEVSMETQRDLLRDLVDPLVSKIKAALEPESKEEKQ